MYEEFIGFYASSMAGHDRGTIYIIVNVEDECVLLSDGRLKTIERPKKKKLKHIQIIKKQDDTIQSKLKANKKIMNEDIKFAIKNYIAKNQ